MAMATNHVECVDHAIKTRIHEVGAARQLALAPVLTNAPAGIFCAQPTSGQRRVQFGNDQAAGHE